jgi:hypothetical protein
VRRPVSCKGGTTAASVARRGCSRRPSSPPPAARFTTDACRPEAGPRTPSHGVERTHLSQRSWR